MDSTYMLLINCILTVIFFSGAFWQYIGSYTFAKYVILFGGIGSPLLTYARVARAEDDFISITALLICMALVTIPFLLFDFKEKFHLFLSLFLLLLTAFLCAVFTNKFSLAVSDETYSRLNSINEIKKIIFTVALFFGVVIYYFTLKNNKKESEVQGLLQEANIKNKILIENDNELHYQILLLQQSQAEMEETQQALKQQTEALLHSEQELKKAEVELLQRQSQIEENRWVEVIINELSNIIRQNEPLGVNAVCDAILQKLIDVLAGLQGIIYVANANHSEILPVASYACAEEYNHFAPILPGQGLTGQTYKDAERRYLENVPSYTFHIFSGLMAIAPEITLIEPLINGVKSYGVIQLVLKQPLALKHFDLLDRFSPILASTISSMQLRTQSSN